MDRFQKRKQTRERRKNQQCRVFEMKIDKSHLSKSTLDCLNQLFVEAKWFYNYCLSHDDINDSNTTAKSVPVKVGNEFEDRSFKILSGAMKQAIKTRLFGSLKSLKALKQNGHKIGRLKFKSRINSIPLQQFHKTHKLDFDQSRIRIENLKSWMRVRGLEQITSDVEIANATLVRKCHDFFLHVTTFQDKQPDNIPDESIGIDFGCETQLTFSDGTKIEFQVPIPKRLRRLDRKIMKGRRKKSNNRQKDQDRRRKVYQRLNDKKRDIRNKVVNAVTKSFTTVVFQDENIHAWSTTHHGKKIQHSAIGSILRDLKHKSLNPIVVDRFFPSTQLCPRCGVLNEMPQSQRVYECDCGFREDRDIKSACCILEEGLKTMVAKGNQSVSVPTDHRDFKPEERLSSTFWDVVNDIHGISVSKTNSLSQEAPPLAVG